MSQLGVGNNDSGTTGDNGSEVSRVAPTPKQLRILAFIAQRRHLPPTVREIGQRFRIRSTNGVNDHLKALERKGLISRGKLKARAVRVTFDGLEALGRNPAEFDAAREGLLDAATEIVSISDVDRIRRYTDARFAAAFDALIAANERWQNAQLRFHGEAA